jgi:hypothetical protein
MAITRPTLTSMHLDRMNRELPYESKRLSRSGTQQTHYSSMGKAAIRVPGLWNSHPLLTIAVDVSGGMRVRSPIQESPPAQPDLRTHSPPVDGADKRYWSGPLSQRVHRR